MFNVKQHIHLKSDGHIYVRRIIYFFTHALLIDTIW